MRRFLSAVLAVGLAVPVTTAAAAGNVSALAPALGVNPVHGQAGISVTLTGSGFTPGPANVLWDGGIRDSFIIGAGGDFTRPFIIPAAAAGNHTISVCGSVLPFGSPCNSGEFEEKANAPFRVETPPVTSPGAGRVDYQLMALEVTQGVRGAIPVRAVPDGPLRLPADDAVHVANRTTVVRAYPWFRTFDGGVAGPVTARLQIQYADGTFGTALRPTTELLMPATGRDLDRMRGNEAQSFNFILPPDLVPEGTYWIHVTINPIGPGHMPETPADSGNNRIFLERVRFKTVQARDIDFRIHVADLAYRDSAGAAVNFMPSQPELSEAMSYVVKTWPIDPSKLRISYRYTRISQNPPPYEGMSYLVTPPIPGYPQWDNQVYLDENTDILEPSVLLRPPYSFAWLAFDPGSWMGCAGNAGIGFTPLFHAGACGPTVAQEAAHSLSLDHAANAHGEIGGGGFNPDYPGSHGQVEPHAFGFDIFQIRAMPPDLGEHTHDFMSYGGNQWVSIYTWEKLAEFFEAPDINAGTFGRTSATVKSADGEHLRIAGDIRNGDDVYLAPVFTVRAPTAMGTGDTGEYTMTLRDAAGNTLAERAFAAYQSSDPAIRKFYELVPAVTGVAKVEIRRNGSLIGTRTARPGVPTVSIVSPVAGDQWAATGQTVVRWDGRDPDGDEVRYRVQISADGTSWHTVHSAATDTAAQLDLAHLPGGGTGWRLRVQASDGLNVATAEVAGLSIAPKPPIPAILQPTGRTFVGIGLSVSAFGQGYDFQDGHLAASSLHWSLDGKPLATGGSADTGALTAGEHKLTLRAINKAGLEGTVEQVIVVGIDADADRLPDDWEGQMGLSAGNPDDAAEDPDGDALPNWREHQLGSDPRDALDPKRHTSHEVQSRPMGTSLAATAPAGGPLNLLLIGGAVAIVVALAIGALVWHRKRGAQPIA